MRRPPLKAERAYVHPCPQRQLLRRDFTPEEWSRYANNLSHAVRSWLHYLETGEKK